MRSRSRSLLALPALVAVGALFALSLGACSSDPAAPDEGTRSGVGGEAGAGGTDTLPEGVAYPPGPYGTSQGSIIADITFAGLRNPKSANYNFESDKIEPISLHDYYNPTGDTSRPRVLLVAASAGWCGPCRQEASESMANWGYWNPKGAEFLTALFDSNTPGTAAAPADATSWSKSYRLEYPMVLDPQQKMGAYANLQAVPFNIVVDLTTMTIVYAQAAVFDATETSPTLTKLLD
jgi:hypothetical protein